MFKTMQLVNSKPDSNSGSLIPKSDLSTTIPPQLYQLSQVTPSNTFNLFRKEILFGGGKTKRKHFADCTAIWDKKLLSPLIQTSNRCISKNYHKMVYNDYIYLLPVTKTHQDLAGFGTPQNFQVELASIVKNKDYI